MSVYTLGKGFISENLPYPVIEDRLEANLLQIENVISKYQPSILVNCIGKTGRPNIDWCETHKEETLLTNTIIPGMLAEVCRKKNIFLIHIASGCVYFGYTDSKGWIETDPANPLSYYSQTKYSADLILKDLEYVASLRIRMPILDKPHPRNLIDKILKYDQVIDAHNSMTFVDDLVEVVNYFVKNPKGGLFHVTNNKYLSPSMILERYNALAPQYKVPFKKFRTINKESLVNLTSVPRSNCLLNNNKLAEFRGMPMPNALNKIDDVLRRYLENVSKI